MAMSIQVTFDCADPARLSTFWAEALGYAIPDPPAGYATWQEFLAERGVPKERWDAASAAEDPDGVGPRLYFQRVPEAKAGKNRVHLDVNVGGGRKTPLDERRARVDAAAVRLVARGARNLGGRVEHEEYWVVMQDPEGNEFCLQ